MARNQGGATPKDLKKEHGQTEKKKIGKSSLLPEKLEEEGGNPNFHIDMVTLT